MTSTGADLLARVERAAGDGVIAPDDARLLALAVRVARRERVTLDAALGLAPAPGQRRWSTIAAAAEANDILRQAARHFFAGLPSAVQARELHKTILRYEASAWLREQAEPACPERRRGTVQAVCWQVLALIGHAPAERTIRRVLAASSAVAGQHDAQQ